MVCLHPVRKNWTLLIVFPFKRSVKQLVFLNCRHLDSGVCPKTRNGLSFTNNSQWTGSLLSFYWFLLLISWLAVKYRSSKSDFSILLACYITLMSRLSALYQRCLWLQLVKQSILGSSLSCTGLESGRWPAVIHWSLWKNVYSDQLVEWLLDVDG